MRQIRTRRTTCPSTLIKQFCYDDLNWFNEDTNSFEFGWNNNENQSLTSSIRRAFQYRTSDEIDSYMMSANHYTYPSGGYIYEFRGRLANVRANLSQLHQHSWIDSQTRAVFIQFTLYNPNVELFTSVILLVEFLSTGGAHPYYRFEPISFVGMFTIERC
jgi:hypothetical protein